MSPEILKKKTLKLKMIKKLNTKVFLMRNESSIDSLVNAENCMIYFKKYKKAILFYFVKFNFQFKVILIFTDACNLSKAFEF